MIMIKTLYNFLLQNLLLKNIESISLFHTLSLVLPAAYIYMYVKQNTSVSTFICMNTNIHV